MYILAQVVIGLIALVMLYFLAITFWQFSVRLKQKYRLLGLVWQGMWLVIGLTATLLTLALVNDWRKESAKDEEMQKIADNQAKIYNACQQTPKAEGGLVKAEYERLKQIGYVGQAAITNIAKQDTDIGRYVFCVMYLDKMSKAELAEYFENY